MEWVKVPRPCPHRLPLCIRHELGATEDVLRIGFRLETFGPEREREGEFIMKNLFFPFPI